MLLFMYLLKNIVIDCVFQWQKYINFQIAPNFFIRYFFFLTINNLFSIYISSIAGCSMGALVGWVNAAGKLNEFRECMKTITRTKMLQLQDFSLSLSASSMMIRQNSILTAKLMKPDMLVDIQMNRYGTFDFDKSEKIIALGRHKTSQAISKFRP